MTDHDMRALALNLAHDSERFPDAVLKRAREYYAFLSGRDETKDRAGVTMATLPAVTSAVGSGASAMTSAEIKRAQDAQSYANVLNPYATTYDQT